MLHITGRRSAKGFTLIEMLLVLGVMALAATIGYSGWSKYRYQTAARMAANQFMQDLRYARKQAQVRATTVAIYWDKNQYSIKIVKDNTTIKSAALLIYGPMMSITPPTGHISFDFRGTKLEGTSPITGVGEWTTDSSLEFGTTATFSSVEVKKTGYAKVHQGKKK